MRKLLPLLALLPLCVAAQNPLFKRVKYTEGASTPKIMVLNDNVRISAMETASFLKQQLNLGDQEDLIILKQFTDKFGFEHIRYQQTLNGVPVFGAEYTAHLKDGFVTKFTGHVADNVNPQSAQLSADDALNSAMNYMGASRYMWEDAYEEALLKRVRHDETATHYPSPELMYFNTSLGWKKPAFELAYEVELYAKTPFRKEKIYVSATNGDIIQTINQLHDADQKAHGVSMFVDTVEIYTIDTLGQFGLFDNTRGGGIETWDLNTSWDYIDAVPFLHGDTLWDIANPELDEAAIDAHWGAEMTYDYFFTQHGRNSYDDNGSTLINFVHYGFAYQNASWDGYAMRYGDGGAGGSPFLSIDIAGHELAHGVTEYANGLIYASESGALNESFSDIWGNCVEYFADSTRYSWYVGEQSSNTLRNMADPNEFSDPDTYNGISWKPTANPSQSNDWGGVHSNSGVQNFWFYLMVEGGTGTNDNGDSYNVAGMGWVDAAEIAYRNASVYLTASSGYMDARDFAYESAADIYGECTPESENVVEAWYAVGVGRRFDAAIEPGFIVNYDFVCELPIIMDFINTTEGATSYLWDFDNGSTSSDEFPSQIFTAEGVYDIQLNSYLDNGCYTDTTLLSQPLSIIEAGYMDTAVCYSSVFIASDFVGISRVKLHHLDHETGLDDPIYNDYTCKSNTILHVDSTYELTITTNPNSRENVRVWIDFNDDQEFQDDELVLSSDDTYTTHTASLNFQGKNPMLKRLLRMRVMSDISFNKNFTSCDGLQNGQTEDYAIIITDDWSDVLDNVSEDMVTAVHVFPNPAKDRLNISVDASEVLRSVTLTDVRGQQVAVSNDRVMDISDLTPGVYMVEIATDQHRYVEKLLVE